MCMWRSAWCLYLIGYPNNLIPLHTKEAILWRFNVYAGDKTYLRLHVQCPNLSKFENSRLSTKGVPGIRFHVNTSNRSRLDTCGRTDRHDEGSRHFLRLRKRPKKLTAVSFSTYCLRITRLNAYAGVIFSALFTNVACFGLRYLSSCTGLFIVLVTGLYVFACWVFVFLWHTHTHTHTHTYIYMYIYIYIYKTVL